MFTQENFKLSLAGLAGVTVALWTSIDRAIQGLLLLMLFDFISGVIAGARGGTLSSAIGVAGLRKKAMVLLVVIGLAIAQHYFATGYGFPELPAAQGLAGLFALLEVFSLLENAGRSGVRFPKVLRKLFAALRDQLGDDVPAAELRKRVTPTA